jgi:diguanylate cyclase (GGDEF)-like protein/PAS domain S-box-containing protein
VKNKLKLSAQVKGLTLVAEQVEPDRAALSFASSLAEDESRAERARRELCLGQSALELQTEELRQANEALRWDICERKQALDRLKESEARFGRLLQDVQLVAVQGYGLDGTTLYWNQASERLYGFSAQEAIGRNLLDLIIPPEMRADFAQAMRQMAETGQLILASEMLLMRKDGSRVEVFSSHTIVHIPGRDPELFCFDIDLSERKRVEDEREALLEIMQGLGVIQDLKDFLSLVHQSIAKVIYAENFFVILYDTKTTLFEEIYSVDKYDPPALPVQLENSIGAYVFRSGQPLLLTQARFDELVAQGELKLVGTNSPSWLGVPLRTSSETIGVMVLQDYDHPNRYSQHDLAFLASIAGQVGLAVVHKRSEDQLRQLSRAVEHSPTSIIITGVDGRIEYFNPKFSTLTGYTLEEVRGKTPRILKSGQTDPEVYAELWQTILSGEEWRGEFLNRKKNGELYWESASISAITDQQGTITHFVAVNEDITERKESEEKIRMLNIELEKLALTDYLTNLYNRRYFMQRGAEEFRRAHRNRQPLALLMLDLDEFKKVNDRYGHEAGDLLLQQVADVMKSSLREIDLLGRLGGEEFAVLLPNTLLDVAVLLAERVRHSIANLSMLWPGQDLSSAVTISIGAAAYTDAMVGIDDLLRNADAALYQAKHSGRNCVVVYADYSENCLDISQRI